MFNLVTLKLFDQISKWGGEVRITDFNKKNSDINIDNGYHICPFDDHLAINTECKILAIHPNNLIHPTSIIHEMGHIFAVNVEPESAYESFFFGWEYCLAKKVDLSPKEFWRENINYMIDDNNLINFSKKQRYKFMASCIKIGNEYGIIRKGQPISVR